MTIRKLYKAKPISYDSVNKRDKKTIKYIVIHYTGNNGDKAVSNAKYFAKANERLAGAHFFVDQAGKVYRSVPMNRTAWSVGGDHRDGTEGEGKYYNKCTNYNSVSIELCDISSKEPSEAMIKATKALVKYIQKYCPNATTLVRHWDVNGKKCPATMAGKNNKSWSKFKKSIR